VLDARADAFGHGLALVAPVAQDAGVATLIVTDESDAGVASSAGFSGSFVVGRWPEAEVSSREAPYGLAPGTNPVLSLIGEVVAVKHVGADAGVSYGYSYRTEAPTTLALIALGYSDGVPRLASNRASVRVASAMRPLVGRVAMDQFVVDCGGDEPDLGSEAVLFGDPARGEPSAHDWAAATGRSPLALTAGIGPRVLRVAR
jgi:alanine racemase